MAIKKSGEIVIVGAGCYGVSTAYHLLRRGFTKITVLDRSDVLPAPHAASTDLNKIVRSAYPDVFYARFAREAIEAWKDEKEWGDTYHECGVFTMMSGGGSYADQAYQSELALGGRIDLLKSEEAIRGIFPPGVKLGALDNKIGYINRDGGWANAAQGVSVLMKKAIALGAKVIPGKAVCKLFKTDGKTTGVECADGSVYSADLVILCAGSWTASSFPTLELGQKCLATAQSIATIQLTPEDGNAYRNMPIYLDFNNGFYIFPPNHENIMKIAVESAGYTSTLPTSLSGVSISTPQFVQPQDGQGSRIPKKELQEIRTQLAKVFPELAKKPFSSTRLCWYTDSPDDDWIIGFHPSDSGVVLATAGSGHAYKFLPNIGGLVADAIEGVLDPALVKKFAVDRQENADVVFRRGRTASELDFGTLCTSEDLLPASS
ncbi:FAD dependent oxidoreductase [Sparassis latifolia]